MSEPEQTPWQNVGETTTGGKVLIAPAGTPAPTDVEIAEAAGRAAALAGESWTANPYRMTQGSPDRVKGFAWRRGFKAGEIDQADGEHFRER